MKKMKKVFAIALALMLVCVFAVSAFAAEAPTTKEGVKAKLAELGLTTDQINALADKYTMADYEAAVAAWNSNDEAKITALYNQALADLKAAGVSVTDPKLEFADGIAVVSATVNGKLVAEYVAAPSASSASSSASSVIKQTGDNSAVVLCAAALSVASVLGLAVRKNKVVA